MNMTNLLQNTAQNSHSMPALKLAFKQDKRLRAGSPWIYSNEIDWNPGLKSLPPGSLVSVYGKNGEAFGTAFFNAKSLIAGRMLSRDPARQIDAVFFRGLFKTALRLREKLFSVPYYRLIHAEADGCPGLIVDRFGDLLVIEVNTAGMEQLQPIWLDPLIELCGAKTVYFKNDSHSRSQEGLEAREYFHAGSIEGPVAVVENDLTFYADIAGGQKTGWFYDQRANRRMVGEICRGANTMLDLYSYLGGFAMNAAKSGVRRAVAVDRSADAMRLAKQSADKNGLGAQCEFIADQAFPYLEQAALDNQKFDVVVADPPAFAKTAKDIPAAKVGYRKLAALAAACVAPNGFLFMASCSYHMDLANFTEQVSGGIHKSGRSGKILRTVFADADHPTHAHLAQSGYLKGLLLQLD